MERPLFIIAAPQAGGETLLAALERSPDVAEKRRTVAFASEATAGADARFIYVYREAKANIASLIASSNAPQGKACIDAAITKWESTSRRILEHLTQLPDAQWTATTYEMLLAEPVNELARLARFAGLAWDERPLLLEILSDDWHEHEVQVMPRMSAIADTNRRAKLMCATSAVTHR